MSRDKELDFQQILLKAHRRGIKNAIDLSARTGVPLVVCENGKIKQIKAPYKYVRVPLKRKKRKK